MNPSLKKHGFIPFDQINEESSSLPENLSKYGFKSFDSYQEKEEEPIQQQDFVSDEQIERDIERSTGRGFARIGETVLGAPGDIASFFSGLFGKKQNLLPGSEDLRKFTKEKSQGYFEPKTEIEEKSDELISDIASMALPGSAKYNFARNIGIPVVGNLIKEGLKYGSADEKSQAYGKIGTMVALDLISGRSGGAKKYAGSLFKQAEEALPKGLSIDARGLEKSLNILEKDLTAGGSRPTTKKSLEKISEIKNEIKNGKIDAKRLAAFRPSINEAIEELGGFQIEVPKKLKPSAIRNLNQVKSETIKTLDQYGRKFNPEFSELSRSANEAWAAYEQSNKITKVLSKILPYSTESKAIQLLFHAGPYAAIAGLTAISPQNVIGATGMLGLYQGYKVLDRVMRSPTLRKFYLNILKNAAAGNIPHATKNLNSLDKELKDFDLENLD